MATHPYSQINDVFVSDRFAGMIVAPNDPVGLAAIGNSVSGRPR